MPQTSAATKQQHTMTVAEATAALAEAQHREGAAARDEAQKQRKSDERELAKFTELADVDAMLQRKSATIERIVALAGELADLAAEMDEARIETLEAAHSARALYRRLGIPEQGAPTGDTYGPGTARLVVRKRLMAEADKSPHARAIAGGEIALWVTPSF